MADKPKRHGGPKKYLPMSDKPKLPPHKIEFGVMLPLAGMQISEGKGQRWVQWPWVQWLSDNWDEAMAGSLVVNVRNDGTIYVCNGQHRWWKRYLAGETEAVCEVHYGLVQPEEALLFDGVNEQKLVKPVDLYMVRKEGDYPLYKLVEKVLANHKLVIEHSASANQVKAVNGVLRICSTYGPDTLDRVLTIAEWAWGRHGDSWDNALLGGLGTFVGKHGKLINDRQFAKKIQTTGPASAFKGLTSARGGEGRVNGAYEVFRTVYNRNRTTNRID